MVKDSALDLSVKANGNTALVFYDRDILEFLALRFN